MPFFMYICRSDSIEKVPNNTITHDFTNIPLNQFSVYFQLEAFIEDAINENQ